MRGKFIDCFIALLLLSFDESVCMYTQLELFWNVSSRIKIAFHRY